MEKLSRNRQDHDKMVLYPRNTDYKLNSESVNTVKQFRWKNYV